MKHFGNTRAVNGVDLQPSDRFGVRRPSANGASKTTTVSMLAAGTRPDAGSAEGIRHDVVADAVAVRSLVGVTGRYASVDGSDRAAEPECFRPAAPASPGRALGRAWNCWRRSR